MKRFAFEPYALIVWAFVVVLLSACGTGYGGDTFVLLFVSVLVTPVVLLLCFLWPARWVLRRRFLRILVSIPLCVALIASVILTLWPLRLNFALAKGRINSIAARVEEGEKVATPVWAGLFRIRKVTLRRGAVGLWTDLERGGHAGLVQSPSASGCAAWSLTQLDENWYFMLED